MAARFAAKRHKPRGRASPPFRWDTSSLGVPRRGPQRGQSKACAQANMIWLHSTSGPFKYFGVVITITLPRAAILPRFHRLGRQKPADNECRRVICFRSREASLRDDQPAAAQIRPTSSKLISQLYPGLSADELNQELPGFTDTVIGVLVHHSPAVRQQIECHQDFGPAAFRPRYRPPP